MNNSDLLKKVKTAQKDGKLIILDSDGITSHDIKKFADENGVKILNHLSRDTESLSTLAEKYNSQRWVNDYALSLLVDYLFKNQEKYKAAIEVAKKSDIELKDEIAELKESVIKNSETEKALALANKSVEELEKSNSANLESIEDLTKQIKTLSDAPKKLIEEKQKLEGEYKAVVERNKKIIAEYKKLDEAMKLSEENVKKSADAYKELEAEYKDSEISLKELADNYKKLDEAYQTLEKNAEAEPKVITKTIVEDNSEEIEMLKTKLAKAVEKIKELESRPIAVEGSKENSKDYAELADELSPKIKNDHPEAKQTPSIARVKPDYLGNWSNMTDTIFKI